jgi:hypothetical protein
MIIKDLTKELDTKAMAAVVGAMDCGAATAAASVYKCTGDILGIMGDKEGKVAAYNHAIGLIHGACT